MKTLQQYFIDAFDKRLIDFALRINRQKNGDISFYIHPLNQNGETLDFIVKDNQLSPNPRIQKEINFWWLENEYRIFVPQTWPKEAIAIAAAHKAGATPGAMFQLIEINGRIELISTEVSI